MKKAGLLVCLAASLALAGTKSFNVTFHEPSVIGGTEFKPGDYKVQLDEQKLVIKHGGAITEAPVKVQTGDAKYNSTVVRYDTADGKYRVQEIRLGGTNMKLVLESPATAEATGSQRP
jgi:hypothetical protein